MSWLKVKINDKDNIINLSHVTRVVRLTDTRIGFEVLRGNEFHRFQIELPDNWNPDVAWNMIQLALVYQTLIDFTISQAEAEAALNTLTNLPQPQIPETFPEEGWDEAFKFLEETPTSEEPLPEEGGDEEVTEVSPDAH